MIFNVALALLKVQKRTRARSPASCTLPCLPPLTPPPPSLLFQTSKDDLIQSDFEGALKFFRVPVPKRYRSEENAKKLMELACSMKVSRGAALTFDPSRDPFKWTATFNCGAPNHR